MSLHKSARRRDHEKLGVDLQIPERPVQGEGNKKHVTEPVCPITHGFSAGTGRREYARLE